MSSQNSILVGKIALAVAAVGMFVWGAHDGPGRPQGHDLLSVSVADRATNPGIALASLHQQVAQSSGAGSLAGSDSGGYNDDTSPGAIFQDVYSLLEQKYVDKMPTNVQFAHGAATAMLASLQDPNTRFLHAADMQEMADEAQGIYHGLGAATIVRVIPHPAFNEAPAYTQLRLTVMDPMPGSPAQQSGLLPGDYITAINGQQIGTLIDAKGRYDPAVNQFQKLKAVENDPVSYNNLVTHLENEQKTALPMTKAQSLVSNGMPKTMVLTVMRPGSPAPLAVTVEPNAVSTVPPVSSRILPGNIGYIKIYQFAGDTPAQFNAALASLKPASLKGLVVDLRDCPGGLLSAGQAVAAKLTHAPSLGILETKSSQKTPLTITPGQSIACPVAVLVNHGTANTAELLAATLEENGSAVYGTQTFGDASDVRPVSLRDGSGFTMTVGQLLTPLGQPFADRGVPPTRTVTHISGQDAPLAQAVTALSHTAA